jgi:hypothetical protein
MLFSLVYVRSTLTPTVGIGSAVIADQKPAPDGLGVAFAFHHP